MTVGISFTHGERLEAVVITDTQLSANGRQSNSVNKVGKFSSESYHGVVFGSGLGNLVEGVVKNLNQLNAESIESFVSNIYLKYKQSEDKYDISYINYIKKEIGKKAQLFLPDNEIIKRNAELLVGLIPESEIEQYIHKQIMAAQQRYDQFKEQENSRFIQNYDQFKQQNKTSFVVVLYDKKLNKIREWYIGNSGIQEYFMDHIEIGSGADGSHMYFAVNLQGINPKTKFGAEDLSFFAINAYNFSTLNQGVGGTPAIIRVSKEGNLQLSASQVSALVNLSGAYLARFKEKNLTREKVVGYIGNILKGKESVYSNIAEDIGLSEKMLKTLCIPYSSWQEMTNQKFYE